MPVLIANSVRFFSQTDERSFFHWLNSIESIEKVFGKGLDINIVLHDKPVSKDDMLEIISAFYRYNVDMRQLRNLENDENRSWLSSENAFWYDRIYK